MFPEPTRVALDWLFDRRNLDPKIQIKHIDTRNQLVEIGTEGSFSRDEWNHLLCLFKTTSFSMYSCGQFIRERILIGASKRGQDTTSSDGSPVAKSQTHQSVATGQCKEDVSPKTGISGQSGE